MSLLYPIVQRIIKRLGRLALLSSQVITPWLQLTGVKRVATRAHLKHDNVESKFLAKV
jgi:hypothetical protein